MSLQRCNTHGVYDGELCPRCPVPAVLNEGQPSASSATEATSEWNGKWCTYCRTDTHSDAECHSTRPADWHPGRFVPCDTGWLRSSTKTTPDCLAGVPLKNKDTSSPAFLMAEAARASIAEPSDDVLLAGMFALIGDGLSVSHRMNCSSNEDYNESKRALGIAFKAMQARQSLGEVASGPSTDRAAPAVAAPASEIEPIGGLGPRHVDDMQQLIAAPASAERKYEPRIIGHDETHDRSAPEPVEPDGYAVVLDDKSSPCGYWFAYAYTTRDIAEKSAARTKGRVVPIFFAASARKFTDERISTMVKHLRGWASSQTIEAADRIEALALNHARYLFLRSHCVEDEGQWWGDLGEKLDAEFDSHIDEAMRLVDSRGQT